MSTVSKTLVLRNGIPFCDQKGLTAHLLAIFLNELLKNVITGDEKLHVSQSMVAKFFSLFVVTGVQEAGRGMDEESNEIKQL